MVCSVAAETDIRLVGWLVEWWVALKAWQLVALMVVREVVEMVILWVAMTADEKVVHWVA